MLIVLPGIGYADSAPGVRSQQAQQAIIETSRLKKLERLAYAANPNLKLAEARTAALKAQMTRKQAEAREAIDRYLRENKLTREDLAGFKLGAITDLQMRIMPYAVVREPSLKPILVQALQNGKPVYPAEFAKWFPGKKPHEVAPGPLLEFYQACLKAEAGKAGQKLAPLVKKAGTPEFMVKAMEEITYLKCMLTVYRTYLDACTPAELKAQRLRLRQFVKS